MASKTSLVLHGSTARLDKMYYFVCRVTVGMRQQFTDYGFGLRAQSGDRFLSLYGLSFGHHDRPPVRLRSTSPAVRHRNANAVSIESHSVFVDRPCKGYRVLPDRTALECPRIAVACQL